MKWLDSLTLPTSGAWSCCGGEHADNRRPQLFYRLAGQSEPAATPDEQGSATTKPEPAEARTCC
jgi:hypothetical protein